MVPFIHQILHLNEYLPIWMQTYGTGIYLVLFLILFCETGLVVTPFLPGDSLLFAVGAMTAISGNSSLGMTEISVLLVVAVFIGDNLNYTLGNLIGHRVLEWPEKPWLRKQHIYRTQEFMRKHGKFAIILARFVPIVRTFAPFVAGLGEMPRKTFLVFSLVGCLAWTQIFLWLGRLFGQNEFVKLHFSWFVLALIILPGLPVAFSVLRSLGGGRCQFRPKH